MYSFQHYCVKVLDAHAETVKAHFAGHFQMRAGSDAGIHFDADFRIGRKGKALTRVSEEVFGLLG